MISTHDENNESLCKIPIFHVGQIHRNMTDAALRGEAADQSVIPDEDIWNSSNRIVSESQFNIAQTIIANPDAIILEEGLNKDISPNDYIVPHTDSGFHFNEEKLHEIKAIFSKGFPKNYSELNTDQARLLILRGAPLVLFSLGILQFIYKTDTFEEVMKAKSQLNEKNFSTHFIWYKPFYNPYVDNPEIKKIVVDRREETALHCAKEAVKNSGKINPVVLLIYGSGHYLDERMKLPQHLNDFIYEGRIETNTTFENHFSNVTKKDYSSGVLVIPSHNRIDKEQFKQIINLYRTTYPSTSMFEKGYRSSSMQALANLLDKIERYHIESITFKDIFTLLSKIDYNRAKLFREGKLENNEEIKTATDKVIFDLRIAFTKNFISQEKIYGARHQQLSCDD